ncbi:MAG: ABC transporter permease [Polyangiaceae bacterium]|nr:ABC transporter permease [Polyangiaceae bacterium]
MAFAVRLALRYMGARRRAFISVGTAFAILGVALGTAALATVLSVTSGFRAQFREKVLGVNAHVLVLKYSHEFRDYREVMESMEGVPGVIGVAPFIINPMMLTHKDRTATGVLVKGVDPELMPKVLDLPRHIVSGSLDGLRVANAKPPSIKQPTSRKKTVPARKISSEKDAGADTREMLHRTIREMLGESALGEPPVDRKHAGNPPSSDASPPGTDSIGDPPLPMAMDPGDPVGKIEPDGGFESELPDDDFIPEEEDPDPCQADSARDFPGIVIGTTLRDTLNVVLGDCIQVTSPTIGYSYSKSGAITPPVAKQFRVIAVFEAGFDQYDAKLVYTDLYEAQAFYDAGDTVTGVEMKVSDVQNAKFTAGLVTTKLNDALYHVMDWEELNHGLFTALRIQQILISLVLALIILVAAFTVLATLIMVVLDKKKEIAVLKAMGATDGTILMVFLSQGLLIGVGGAAVGLGFGYAMCKWILIRGFPLDPKVYFISHVPVNLNPTEFWITGAFAVLVCVVATAWPAMHAARLRPAEAFRSE